jgi:hypothetical protein
LLGKLSLKVNTVEKDASEWRTYRTRFLVRARRLTEVTAFLDPMGREQRGNVGDYLVESAIGFRRIMPRKFFEDVYVAIKSDAVAPPAKAALPAITNDSAACAPPKPVKAHIPAVENKSTSQAPRPLIA